MNCYKCATPLPDHSKFCMACGADVSGEGHMHSTVGSSDDPELMAALQAELGSDYIIERELGRGGMAIVYLGKDAHLGRKVAIKLLPPMLTFGSGPGFIERFKREARTSATLDHPHIIPIYRVSTGGKLFWYVMKFLQGESVDETLKREGAFEVDRIVNMISQVGDALDYAHSNDVVHRDVKPANMMVDKKGWVTVTDFGIAKALNTGTLTGSGAAIGTPHYMAPEQCVGVGVSGASDQYALGVSAYQMLTGDLPFKADSILELMRMHSQDPPPPLAERRSGLPPGLIAAVERALAKDPAERFPSCADFARELARFAVGAPPGVHRPTPPAMKATIAEPQRLKPVVKPRADTPIRPSAPTFVTDGPVAPKGRNWTLINSMLALAIVVGAGAIYKLNQPKAPSQLPANQPTPSEQTTPIQAKVDSPAVNDSTARVVQAESTKAPAPSPNALQGSKRGASTRAAGVTGGKSTAPTRPEVKAPPPEVKRETPAVTGTATLTVGSRTPAAILINGKPYEGNPLRNETVPAGRVRITFQVTDSTGVWTMDTVVTMTAGETRNLGRITLVRRP